MVAPPPAQPDGMDLADGSDSSQKHRGHRCPLSPAKIGAADKRFVLKQTEENSALIKNRRSVGGNLFNNIHLSDSKQTGVKGNGVLFPGGVCSFTHKQGSIQCLGMSDLIQPVFRDCLRTFILNGNLSQALLA